MASHGCGGIRTEGNFFLFSFSFLGATKIKRVPFLCTELVPTYNKYRSKITANHLQFLLSLRCKIEEYVGFIWNEHPGRQNICSIVQIEIK